MTDTTHISVTDFLNMSAVIPVVDVRSPSEFEAGHIVGSTNIPLFDDDERSIVGKIYNRHGSIEAISKGMELISNNIKAKVDQVQNITRTKVILYCWRGGQRSSAMAWLYNQCGMEVYVIEGGYKAYRRYIRNLFTGYPLSILSGYTGSGKTEILELLRQSGEQVIDLEALAQHRGSAFGQLGMGSQPSTEQFENMLASEWLKLDKTRPVWIEDESQNIGTVSLPLTLYHEIIKARVVRVHCTLNERVERLVKNYGHYPLADICRSIGKISKRLGSEKAQLACHLVQEGDIAGAIRLILSYYDKYYDKSFPGRNTVLEFDYTALNQEAKQKTDELLKFSQQIPAFNE